MASIKACNMLEFRPILVDDDMRIIDGQHRLEAAKALGIEIFYQVRSAATHEDIVILNAPQKSWNSEDYVNYYVSLGKSDYLKFKEYSQQKGVTVGQLVRLFTGRASTVLWKIKTGELKFFGDNELADMDARFLKMESAITIMKTYILGDHKFLLSNKLKAGLIRFLENEDVVFDTLLAKLRIKSDAIKPCADVQSYCVMFRDIYNWKNSNPIT
jgi:hypothetical protein